MSRINSNVTSMIAQRVLSNNNLQLNTSLERLSTGLRINRGKDDPAGLIVSEALRSEEKALGQAISNASRADQVANIAEGGLQEVSNLLTELQGLITASANDGLSGDEKRANQLQIDSILQTIDRISSATNFQGIRLLNGNMDYTLSGVANSNISDFRVNSAKFTGSSQDVTANVTGSAQQAGVFVMTGATLDLNDNEQFSIEVAGSKGNRVFTFAAGTTVAQMQDAIDTFKDVTGVEVASTTGSGLKLVSTGWGSDEFVSVKVLEDAGINSTDNGGATATARGIYGYQTDSFFNRLTSVSTFSAVGEAGSRDSGRDVAGTINGIVGTGRGKTLSVNTDFLDVSLTLTNSASRATGNVGGTSAGVTFSITGGGADFTLASRVDVGGRVSLGIQNVSTRSLGTTDLGFLNSLASGRANSVASADDLSDAQEIVSEAINQVSNLRGRLGAFQKNVVGSTIRALNVSLENTSAAQSQIRDADFAAETANLTRAQILVSAATNVLSLANSQPQTALQLLG